MRILHAADFGGASPGGFVPLLVALAQAVAARGDTLAIAVPDVVGASWHAQVRDAGAELHVVAGGADAARFARAWSPDVAHVHFFGWEIPVTLALWPTRARVFWHAHSTSLRGGIGPTPRSLLKYRGAGARVERHVAVSHAIAQELIRRGAPQRRVVVVPNAVDPRRFRPPRPDERVAARAALDVLADRVVLFYGRDPHLKGADLLAAALARLPGTTVVAVATPADARAALAEHARIVAVDRTDDVRPLLWAADALAMPSRGEGSPLAFLEASAAGVPIAASDLPALREAGRGRTGIRYAPVGDAAALAAALADALALGRLPFVTTPYDPDAWAQRIVALYDDASHSEAAAR